MKSGMRKSTRVSAIAFAFAVSAILAVAGPELAGEPLTGTGGLPYRGYGWGHYGNGPVYYGEYGPAAYDSYAFAYEYPVYTGSPVTATAVGSFQLSLPPSASCWASGRLLSERVSKRVPH